MPLIGLGVSAAMQMPALARSSLDAATEAVIAAMSVEPSAARKTIINDTIVALKDAGVFSKLDCLYFMAAHDEQAGRVNWVAPGTFLLSISGSPVFTADVGFKSDGSGYLSSGFIPINEGDSESPPVANFASSNASVFARATEDYAAADVTAVGASNGSNFGLVRVRPKTAGGADAAVNVLDAGFVAANADARVLVAANRAGVDAAYLYIGGSVVDDDPTTRSPNLTSSTITVLGMDIEGTVSQHMTTNVGVVGWGAYLDGAENAALNTAIEAYLSAIS